MAAKFAVGVDFGTNSMRALIADVADGREVAGASCGYRHGEAGVVLDPDNADLARQHPTDYLQALEGAVTEALSLAQDDPEFSAASVIGVGVDATGSTPMPVDAEGRPLAFQERFRDEPAALAWLWKDHTAHEEARQITEEALEMRPHYVAGTGGSYSPEWFWAKALHCLRSAPEVFEAAHTWVELCDWLPAVLSGTGDPQRLKRGACAAGHKAIYHPQWGGYPDAEFLAALDEGLLRLRDTLPDGVHTVAEAAGGLTGRWAARLGLPEGIPVAVGLIDAHMGAIGAGVRPGVLVRVVGTSSCDMTVVPLERDLPQIPGLCGTVPESILPGYYGLEAGQAAVGDIYNWFVNSIRPGGEAEGSHEALTAEAGRLKPGESGLLALDWHNGNRTVLMDQRLTGLLVGMTLQTRPAEIYRALIESTAFGARVIMERLQQHEIPVERVVNCGGIPHKNPLVMQINADIMGRTMQVARSRQTCALGAAMAGAVVAGPAAGGYADFAQAADAMTGVQTRAYEPDPQARATYDVLYGFYRRLYDAFGAGDYAANLGEVMKGLLAVRDRVRG